MAGLEAFIRRDHLAGRQAAQAMKLPTSKKSTDGPKLPAPIVSRQQTPTPPGQRDIFEGSTIGSDFDITRSEIEVNDAQYGVDQYGGELEQEWNYPSMRYESPHILPSVVHTPKSTKRTGRFDSGLPPRASKLELRNGHSKKRSHSRHNSQFSTAANYAEQPRVNDDDVYQDSSPETSQSEQDRQQDDTIHASQRIDNFDATSLGETTIELTPRDNRKSGNHSTLKHTSPGYQGDYTDKELRSMSYKALQEESFETDAHPPQPEIPRHLQGPNITLSDRISYFVDSRNTDAQELFFGRMTMEEWEQTGEWFLEKFGAILQEFGQARKNKRMLVTKFEEEIGAREKAVRGKINGINRELDDMQNGGEMVLRGKSV
ncbi:extracellular mutant protein 11-domain-containing protein [Xylogone sp. PMI_703]|nr:extracellular mutant protein 11-domain-containing protein [Xylogone sp. PMI_703]